MNETRVWSGNRAPMPALVVIVGVIGVGVTTSSAGQTPAAGIYTADQAQAGRAVYEQECAPCHQSNLQGSFEAPPLAGESFLRFWGDLSPRDLFDRIRTSMPPEQPGALGAGAYLGVVAYLLQANGAPAGRNELSAETRVTITSVVTGNPPPTGQPEPGGRTQAAQDASSSGLGGLTVAGTVQDYRPVTDAMLRNQDPGDWLMIRRTYDAWSHSPLAEITRDNIGRLKLAWIWAMNEGGFNAPSPIAHDGVLYLAGTGPVVQALDAQTGDLIWEHRVAVAMPGITGTSRNLAIYEDRLFLATPDARLLALDARTGEQVWDTTIADYAKGFSNSSGPIVVGGKVVQGLSGCGRFTREGWLHQRLRRRDGRAVVAVKHRGPFGRSGRKHMGEPAGLSACWW